MHSLGVLFGNHARRVSRTLGSLLLLALVSGMASPPAAGQPFPAACAQPIAAAATSAAANDINIATVTVNNGVTSCAAGTSVTLDLSLLLRSNANQRFDIGVFVALDGKSPIIRSTAGGSASCSVVGLPMSPPPLANLDGNACGDIASSGPVSINVGTVTVPCTPDATGHLVLPAVVTWDNNSSPTSCQAPPAQWVQASTKSNCSAGITAQIPVTVTGRITVVKDTTPSGSPGSFAFNASGPAVSPAAFSLAAGQQQVLNTAQLTATPQIYTVTEQAAAGFDLSSLQCIDDLDNQTHPEFVTVDLSARTATIRMSSIPTQGLTSATCSFSNTRQSSITVVKKTLGGDATFQFSGPSPFAITTQGGTGQRVFPALPPGTYTVSEIVPAGWTRSNTVCTDPTGDTTVARRHRNHPARRRRGRDLHVYRHQARCDPGQQKYGGRRRNVHVHGPAELPDHHDVRRRGTVRVAGPRARYLYDHRVGAGRLAAERNRLHRPHQQLDDVGQHRHHQRCAR